MAGVFTQDARQFFDLGVVQGGHKHETRFEQFHLRCRGKIANSFISVFSWLPCNGNTDAGDRFQRQLGRGRVLLGGVLAPLSFRGSSGDSGTAAGAFAIAKHSTRSGASSSTFVHAPVPRHEEPFRPHRRWPGPFVRRPKSCPLRRHRHLFPSTSFSKAANCPVETSTWLSKRLIVFAQLDAECVADQSAASSCKPSSCFFIAS